MENIPRFIREFRIPKKDDLKKAFQTFSKKQRIIFLVFFAMLIVGTSLLLKKVNDIFLVEIPADGGSLTEGIVGPPRFVNPVLAISDSDKDLTSVIYSGLMKKSADGEIVPDLARDYTISEDGLVYTFNIDPNAVFHDGTRVTANDIAFTITRIKDSALKSPKRVSFEGVSVEARDDATVVLTLKQPYISFLENLTIGILPEHLWGNIVLAEWNYSDLNTNPIGSGPYKVRSVSKKSNGIPDSYTLSPFAGYLSGKPHIGKLVFKFYSNEKELTTALRNNDIEQASALSPEIAKNLSKEGYKFTSSTLPRIFGLFFNQNQAPIFADHSVISALDKVIDKNKIVAEVLDGYGASIDGPIPPHFINNLEDAIVPSANVEDAAAVLEKAGWTKSESGLYEKKDKSGNITELKFSIATGDAPELVNTANSIKRDLEAFGVAVDIKTYEIGQLNQTVIRPRKYDALLFGEIINHESDFFAFWHSSQRNDPGLNVAQYTNTKVDKILEDLMTTKNADDRIALYKKFQDEIAADSGAVFLYAPDFIYAISKNLSGMKIDNILTAQDRFNGIANWYTESDKIWRVFIKD